MPLRPFAPITEQTGFPLYNGQNLTKVVSHPFRDPVQDPHGAPIPTRDGRVEESALRTLAEAGAGEQVRVRRVHDKEPERLRYLAELGIRPGSLVRILDKAPFEGPITVWVEDSGGGATRAVGVALAAQVYVESIAADLL